MAYKTQPEESTNLHHIINHRGVIAPNYQTAQRQENKNAFYNFSEKTFRIEKIVGTSDSGHDTESIYV